MMKVTLVRPNYRSHLITPPLNLGYLSSYLQARGWEVDIVDALNLGLSPAQVVDKCQDSQVVGLSCLSAYFREVMDLSRRLKVLDKIVVLGGPHATALPELALAQTGADYAVVGEGELTFGELLSRLNDPGSLAGLPGLYRRGGPAPTPRPLLSDLDSLPFPDWDQINPGSYRAAPHGGLVKEFPVAPVITSRGCAFTCDFCASPRLWSGRVRFRSVENVLAEIELLVKKYQVKEIHFSDDNLTLKQSHILELCDGLLRRHLKVRWALPNGIRTEGITPFILRRMRQSGCYAAAFGIESGVQEILDNCHKKADLRQIARVVRQAKEAGLVTQGFFILGLPGETPETLRQTLKFALELPLDKAQFLIFDVLPGSRHWDRLAPERLREDWDYRSFQEPVWVPPGLTCQALKRMQSYAFCRFFLRPRPLRFIINHLKLRQLPFVWQRARDFIWPTVSAP